MVETQFFSRQNNGLEKYKLDFKEALEKVKVVNLFPFEVIEFLSNWLEYQKTYIPRDDVDNFLSNMQLIFKDKNFYDFVFKKQQGIKNNGNIIEYSFNLISNLDDSRIGFEKSEKERLKKEDLKKNEEKLQEEDKKKLDEIEKILEKL